MLISDSALLQENRERMTRPLVVIINGVLEDTVFMTPLLQQHEVCITSSAFQAV